MIDDGTSTEAYIHSLTLSFPHIIKAEEIELQVVRGLSEQAGRSYGLQPSGDSWPRWSL